LEEDGPRQRSRISAKLDDPSFPAPICALLVKVDGVDADRAAAATDPSSIIGAASFGGGSLFGLLARSPGSGKSILFEEIANGSALARARVKHETCRPGRSPRSSALLFELKTLLS
jgi:hypothetical protein